MSASQEKKLRKQLRETGQDKRQLAQKKAEKAKKRTRVTQAVVIVVLVLAVISLITFNSNLLYGNFTAARAGGTRYTAAEYTFFYKSAYNNFVQQYGDYLEYMGLDTTKSLSSQQYGEDQTWADFFKETARNNIKEVTALYDDAVKEGFQLSEEDRLSLETTIQSYEANYSAYGFASVNAFLAAQYGRGCTLSVVSRLIERSFIAQAYAQEKNDSFTYTAAELDAYYAENKDDLDYYSYLSYFADGSVIETDAGTDAEADPDASPDPAEADAAKAEAMAAAKELADSVIADAETADAFKSAVVSAGGTEPTETPTQGSSLSGSSYADWLKNASRRAGDTTVIETDTGYYALYFIDRDDNSYNAVSVRHILVNAAADESGAYTDEAKDEAKAKAEELLAEWKAGDATEDSFAALANSNSGDTGSNTNGGLYENIRKGTMVQEFNDWSFDPARKPGDTGVVYGESASYAGYHVMYFVSRDETYADLLADSALRGAAFTEWQ
ncbi:MAG: peptidyl-prolyl cis-trans isomerase, partial [Oscillospiraceae bacterium]|nr:peptidyl-prolyl cis-trans isomerase [Oscillospiraceae bacterium]